MKLKDLNKKIAKEKQIEKKDCPDCHGLGYICRVFGETTTCWRCLKAGRLNNG